MFVGIWSLVMCPHSTGCYCVRLFSLFAFIVLHVIHYCSVPHAMSVLWRPPVSFEPNCIIASKYCEVSIHVVILEVIQPAFSLETSHIKSSALLISPGLLKYYRLATI